MSKKKTLIDTDYLISLGMKEALIEKLDEEHNEYIINKFMSGGDSGTLDEGGCIKF